jgi:hypothetical protein
MLMLALTSRVNIIIHMAELDQFKVVGEMPLADVEAGLRASPLLHDRETFPFAEADISFDWATKEEVLPSSLIAVIRKLVRQRNISSAMKATVGFDQYELENGGVMLEGGPEGLQGLIPPVVVEAQDLAGNQRSTVLDGLHRAYDCFMLQERERLLVATVTNAAPDWRAYAYTNQWFDVRIKSEKPDDKTQWKHYVGDPSKNEEYASYVDMGHLNGSRPYIPGEGKTDI